MNKTQLVSITPDAEKMIIYIARVSNPKNQSNPEIAGLLRYLIENKHWSPFEHAFATFEINTTRAIAAQILRHRSFTFQEFSQRYSAVDTQHVPDPEMRLKCKSNRQSSTEVTREFEFQINNALICSYGVYETLLANGVAPECARMILPMCAPTRIYMSGSIRSWIHYLELRCDNHTQKEHRQIATEIKLELTSRLPTIFGAL